jgi:hypothetical protein
MQSKNNPSCLGTMPQFGREQILNLQTYMDESLAPLVDDILQEVNLSCKLVRHEYFYLWGLW